MQSIQSKLLFSYLIILAVVAVVLWAAAFFVAPTAYTRHMMLDDRDGKVVTPQPGMMGTGMRPNPQVRSQLPFTNFRAGLFEAMSYALVAALLVAIGLSLYFSRRIVLPLRQMARASQRIAHGHYSERVSFSGSDELAQLGGQFNEMAAQLEQVEAMRRRLVGDVSHELRTPLTSIQGYMEGLIDGVLPATPETYQQIHAEARRLSRLVDDLQELSRVEAGAYQLDVCPVALPELVQITARRLAPELEKKQIQLTLSLPPDLPLIQADADRLIQVLTNLLGNALQYTPAGGQVTISASRIGSDLQFSVADTGLGIPTESLPHVFDRFYRVDKSRSRQQGGGSGIGLTVARHLVEAHGGRIWVESPGPNQGSTFYVRLPISQARTA